MNRSYIFWLATAFGILVGIYLYFKYIDNDNREHFVDTADVDKEANAAETVNVSQSSNTAIVSGTNCPPGIFIEDISVIPYNTKMKVYLSSFSTSIIGKTSAPYCPNLMRWFDLKNPSVFFNVNTASPPSSIVGKGLAMKNVILLGPPSDYLATDNSAFELNPFTLFLYASMNAPDFTNITEITIFRIYAETPNSVRLTLKPSQMVGHTIVELVLGAERNRYVWDITTSTLLSNGNPTLYALTVDTNINSKDKTAILYIGKTKYTADITISSPIKLGNSHMEINSFGSLNAVLYSFGFIEQKLTDTEIDTLSDYMNKQQTGVERKIAETANQKDNETAATVSALNNELKECKYSEPATASTNVVSDTNRRWIIDKPEDETVSTNGTEQETETGTETETNMETVSGIDMGGASETESGSIINNVNGIENKETFVSKTKPIPTPAIVYKNNDYNISYFEDINGNMNNTSSKKPINSSVLENTSVPSTKKYSSRSVNSSTLPKSVDHSKTVANNRMTTVQGIDPPYYDDTTTSVNNVPIGINASKL